MKARLFCTTGILAGRKYEFTQQATIGSGGACAIVIDAPGLARVQARIFYEQSAGCFFLEDADAQISTRVDGVPIKRKVKLGALHVITFARQFDFVFQTIATPAQKERAAARPVVPAEVHESTLAEEKRIWAASPIRKKNLPPRARTSQRNGKTLIEDLLKAQNTAKSQPAAAVTLIESLSVREEAQPSRASLQLEALRSGKPLGTFVLKDGENVVGRSPECEIFIDDPSISRRHASLIVAANQVRVRDLGSRNHTYLDKATVVSEMEIPLESKLRFGMIEARLVS
ncbi:FHA domain-containing protein [candidate division KSB1 bacterium]|nr:FHA domain-containing protein [candidate division KSB1 bacterium]